MAVFIIGLLTFLVIAEGLVIWRLMDRLLIQAHIPSLTPARAITPEPTERAARKPLFSIPIDQ